MQHAGAQRPILFLDVDGVLMVSVSVELADGTWSPEVDLVPGAADMLAQLAEAFDIWWATRWGESANTRLSPELGLPALPVVNLDGPDTVWSKLPAVAEAAGTRPAAWIDDDLGRDEWRWADDRLEPTLLVQTDMTEGMTPRDVDELLAFAASLRG